MNLAYTLLYVDDVPAALDFYERAFGLVRGFLHESNAYGELSTGATKLGFVQHEVAASHGFAYAAIRPTAPPPGFELGFTTTDVGAAYARAVEAGATPLSPPEQKPWGQTVAYVRDLNGTLVEICTAMGE